MVTTSKMFEEVEDVSIRPTLYKRQQFILTLMQKLKTKVTATDFQKIVFLYLKRKNLTYYDFVPYKFGAYSFQLTKDIDFLSSVGYLAPENKVTVLETYASIAPIDLSLIENLRGDALIRKSYELYPYYAINSEITERVLDSVALQRVQSVVQQLFDNEQKLFSIGYEGKSIEQFINLLLINNVRVLCDIRSNPLSRKFGFSQDKLKHVTESVGISYIHIPSLGIESQLRQSLETQEDYANLFAKYKETLPSKKQALQELFSLVKSNIRVAIMCFEKDPNCCHRNIVKNFLTEEYQINSENL